MNVVIKLNTSNHANRNKNGATIAFIDRPGGAEAMKRLSSSAQGGGAMCGGRLEVQITQSAKG
jgi:hypothetical protein